MAWSLSGFQREEPRICRRGRVDDSNLKRWYPDLVSIISLFFFTSIISRLQTFTSILCSIFEGQNMLSYQKRRMMNSSVCKYLTFVRWLAVVLRVGVWHSTTIVAHWTRRTDFGPLLVVIRRMIPESSPYIRDNPECLRVIVLISRQLATVAM